MRVALAIALLGFVETVPQPSRTATIRGVVIDRLTRAPIEGAILTLSSAERKHKINASTDAAGSFTFEGVQPGEYWLDAEKDGYAAETHGIAVTPGWKAGVFRVSGGETRNDFRFALTRAGSISGVVTDETGEPIKNAQVQAVHTSEPTRLRLFAAYTTKTNDRGEYTLRNIAEGHYYVLVRVFPESPASATYEPTFFPGVRKSTDATAIAAITGEVSAGINVRLAADARVRVGGHVIRGSSTGPISATLYASGASIQSVQVTLDGTFTTAVAPGAYSLAAWADAAARMEAGVTHIQVNAEVDGLLLTLADTGTISGRIVTDDNSPLPSDVIQVTAALARHGRVIDPLSRNRSDVVADGSFHISDVFGERVLRVDGVAGWEMAKMTRGKTPIESIAVAPREEIGDVVIILRRR